MDGSFSNESLPEGLAAVMENVTTFAEVQARVRQWARERAYFPCATSATETAIVVSYHDSQMGCRQVRIPVLLALARQFLLESEASQSSW